MSKREAGILVVAVLVVLVGGSLSHSEVGASGVQSVLVTNFPDVQGIKGDVVVTRPIPQSRLFQDGRVVSPADPHEVNHLTEGPVLDAAGFTSLVLSLSGEIKGPIPRDGRVGVILIPDEEEIVRVFLTDGRAQFPLSVEAPVSVSDDGVFESQQVFHRLGFPRYRVYYYDTTPRSAQVTFFAYLTGS
jgi:hypothetical protein